MQIKLFQASEKLFRWNFPHSFHNQMIVLQTNCVQVDKIYLTFIVKHQLQSMNPTAISLNFHDQYLISSNNNSTMLCKKVIRINETI